MSRPRPSAQMNIDERVDRYLAIIDWAKVRYSQMCADGRKRYATRIFSEVSRFAKIEDMAAATYMGCKEHHADMPLRACPAFPPKYMTGE